jgi:hypothetical protein
MSSRKLEEEYYRDKAYLKFESLAIEKSAPHGKICKYNNKEIGLD